MVVEPFAARPPWTAAEGVCLVGQADQATTAFFFAEDAASLRKVLTTHMDRLARPDILWVAYPKGNGR